MEVWMLLLILLYVISGIVFFKNMSKKDHEMSSVVRLSYITFLISSAAILAAMIACTAIWLIENVSWSWLRYKIL